MMSAGKSNYNNIIIVIIGFAVDSYWMKNGSHFFKLAIQ